MPSFTWIILPILLLLACIVSQVCACFAVIVGRDASADGSVLLGHNEENYGRHILNFRRIGRQQHDPGDVVRLHRGGKLEQVPETWAFLWSENPGLEFSDAYLNQWGVAIVSDACATREDDYLALVQRGEIRNGGIGYMLRRLVAQRAKSAREGVELAGRLIERFGYAHSGRTYVIADPSEAWLLAVVHGRRWVAQRVPDDAVVVLPNVHIIGEVNLDDTDNFLASPDLVDYAIQRGWFGAAGEEPFNFRKVYQTPDRTAPDQRQWWGQQLVTESRSSWPPEGPLPFAVKPAKKLTVASLAAILRDCSGPVPLFRPATQESAIFQLRTRLPRQIGCVWWRTTGRPDTSVQTPWYLGITETPPRYYQNVDPQTQLSLEHHFNPPPETFRPDPELAWWTFAALEELVDENYRARIGIVCPVWAALEDRVFGRQEAVEAKALKMWRTDQTATRAFLTQYSAELAAEAEREAEKLIASFRHAKPE